MRMGHYDHGSAVAVADADGDGLHDIYFVNQKHVCHLGHRIILISVSYNLWLEH